MGEVNQGWPIIMNALNHERVALAATGSLARAIAVSLGLGLGLLIAVARRIDLHLGGEVLTRSGHQTGQHAAVRVIQRAVVGVPNHQVTARLRRGRARRQLVILEIGGVDLAKASDTEIEAVRNEIQMIFQDPAESLNSRHTVGNLIGEAFDIHDIEDIDWRRQRVTELLQQVGLPAAAADR